MVSLLTIFSVSAYSSSQTPIKFQQLSKEQGLSQSSVFSITQDKKGFIWLATQDGLNKYDGYEFSHYRTELNNPNSLLDNFVRVVFVDSTNRLWVGTQGGLSLYKPSTDEFKNTFTNLKDKAIWSIYEDNNNNLFVSTADGLFKLNRTTDDFSLINFRDFSKEIKEIKSIFQDSQGNYWIGTYENGLFLINKSLNYISPLNGKNKWHLDIQAQGIHQIVEIEKDYWVASDNGVYIVNDKYEVKKHILPENYGSSLLANKTRSLTQSNEEEVLIGTENGLYRYNLITDELSNNKILTKDSIPFEIKFVYSIFKDRSNSIWVGTFYNGVNKFNPTFSLFPHYLSGENNDSMNVLGFAELPNGNIWVYTEFNGLFLLDYATNDIKKKPQ